MSEVLWVSASAADDLWEGDLIDVEVECEPVMLVHLLDGPVQRALTAGRAGQQIALPHDGDLDLVAHGVPPGSSGRRWMSVSMR